MTGAPVIDVAAVEWVISSVVHEDSSTALDGSVVGRDSVSAVVSVVGEASRNGEKEVSEETIGTGSERPRRRSTQRRAGLAVVSGDTVVDIVVIGSGSAVVTGEAVRGGNNFAAHEAPSTQLQNTDKMKNSRNMATRLSYRKVGLNNIIRIADIFLRSGNIEVSTQQYWDSISVNYVHIVDEKRMNGTLSS